MLVPTWFHFGLERRIIKMIEFWIDFLAILVQFGEPGANKTHFIFDSVFNSAFRADLDGLGSQNLIAKGINLDILARRKSMHAQLQAPARPLLHGGLNLDSERHSENL